MADIDNEAQLIELMEKRIREALKDIQEEVIKLFKEQYLRKYVYASPESHSANVRYYDNTRTPTYEFEKAWDWSDIRKELDTLSTQMWFNPGKMSFDMDTFKHGSKYSTPPDVRASLMDILNKDGYSSSLWLSVKRKVAYWDRFIEDLFDRGELGKIVEKHFLSKGFTRV